MSGYQERTIASQDGTKLHLRIYEAAAASKAVVKIIHGMEEHQGRYEAFAAYLREAGYTVVTADLRGHGPGAEMLSHIADRNGHVRLLEDEKAILDMIHEEWSGAPVVLIGHSMGTIIARAFLQTMSREYHKVVLSGYPNPNNAASAGIVLTDVLTAIKGPKAKSSLVDGMVLGPFSKAIPDAKTALDWLSVNEENVRQYEADPLCGEAFTLGSYGALFRLMRMMDQPEKYEEVWKDLPMLLISGKDDPCTGGEKGRADSLDRLEKAGFRDIKVEVLDGMRHEILNETGREEVYQRILGFLDQEV